MLFIMSSYLLWISAASDDFTGIVDHNIDTIINFWPHYLNTQILKKNNKGENISVWVLIMRNINIVTFLVWYMFK